MFKGYAVLNDGLEDTRKILNKTNDKLYYDLTLKLQTEGDSIQEDFNLGMRIRDTSARLIKYINEMKVLLITKAEDKERSEIEAQDTIISLNYIRNYDDYTTPSKILVGDNYWTPKSGEFTASELISKIDAFASIMDTVWTDEDELKYQNNHLFSVHSYNWNQKHIKDKPLVAVISILSKLQLDIKLQEQAAIRQLISK